MVGKRKIVAIAAGAHLALAALYAPHIPIEPHLPRSIDRVLALYGRLSGVHTHFDFFAPSVATQARAQFRIIAADGSAHEVRLATPSGEVNTRIAMMLKFYAYAEQAPHILRGMGEYMLRLNPQAATVVTRVEVLDIPTLEAAAAGARPRWVELGSSTLRREDARGG
jgi:hypothetical protein